jgi:ribosomal protein RSM22 (predicted rRNA methylase)
MQLPAGLRHALAEELEGCDSAALRAAVAQLSEYYRAGAAPPVLGTRAMLAAYLTVRLPATYAAVSQALRWTRERCALAPRTVLDLGSGPGTALWAAAECWPELEQATAVERDGLMREAAQRLAAHTERAALKQTTWLAGDVTTHLPEGSWELVLCSYALNELPSAKRAALLAQAWQRTSGVLLLVEPGTVAGFANLACARTQLLAAGATLIAPCPHALACPMLAAGDWCHFAARVERTAEHRRLKGAELNYEDEKFAYLAVGRADALAAGVAAIPHLAQGGPNMGHQGRIVRHPRIFSGYAKLSLCRAGTLEAVTVTRSQKEDWRRLKRLGWGDEW